jgi:hypothetical protein
MEKKKCLECNEVLIGRIDKKFCDDVCRNNHNNKLNGKRNNLLRNIIRALQKNRQVLEMMKDSNRIPAKVLVNNGFTFDYYTHTKKIGDENIFFCFDFGYKILEGFFIQIVYAMPTGETAD